MTKKLILMIVLVFGTYPLLAQTKTVSGNVTDATTGMPLPGVNLLVQGTTKGTQTDFDGNYSIEAASGDVLVFSYLGMKNQAITVGTEKIINLAMLEDAEQLGEVVVTALGAERKSNQVTYATQKVDGNELTKVPETNFINSISGKVAGVSVYRNASGVGGSAKVLIRGSKSAQGNNQPLYVINGVPMANFVTESINQSFSSSDGGDGISNLNPDDIESINVLKGASAAALYGSKAANGVILITTKRGKSGVSTLDYSSSFSLDMIAYKPKLQNSFGQSSPDSEESWGAPITDSPDNISGYLGHGKTLINSISFSSGSEKMRTYLSYANTSSKGVLDDNKLTRHNISIRETAKFLNEKLTVEASANIVNQSIDNPPVSGFQATQLFGLYTFPRGQSIEPYKNFEILDEVRNIGTQNWPFITASNQNPYWVANRNLFENKRNRSIVNILAKYDITNWLNVQARGNMDKTNDINTKKYYVGTATAYGGLNGGYNILNRTLTEYYGDAILNFSQSLGKINLIGLVGSSITDTRSNGIAAGSTLLFIPNVFTIQNMNPINGGNASSLSEARQQLQAVFGNINLTYDDWLSLDVTGRNDWSSNLSFTPNGSYFYPSFGLSALLNEALKLPETINYAKLRGSYAIVGNTVPVYVTNPQNYLNNRGNISFNNRAPFTDLKPEESRSLELGAEVRLLSNQLTFDFTYYKTNTINQFFSVSVPPGTGYSSRYINGGDIQNSGIEITLGYANLPSNSVMWNSSLNFTTNKNVIKELAADIDQFALTSDINNYYSILKVGGSYGDLYGQVLKRDEMGRVAINEQGRPVTQTGEPSLLGNSNPDFQLGFNNNFNYKDFSLSIQLDGSFGGEVMSLSEQIFDGYGVSERSGEARLNGGLEINGYLDGTNTAVTSVDAQDWYQTTGGIRGVTGEYVYDATNARLREVSLGYSLPTALLKDGFFKSIKLSLIGRNVFYLYRDAPFDPEIIFSTGNGYSGVEILSLPATRSVGLNLNMTF